MQRERTGEAAHLLVIGLGNPGDEYEGTRHNLGADVVTVLATRHHAPLRRGKERALVGEARIDGRLLVLAFPQTFVNLSGEAAARLVRRYGVEKDLSRVVVVHDELDLPPGKVKIKEGGGTAGHNGLESIRAHLHSGAFIRVRIGIGKPPGRQEGADYVLRRPRKPEQLELDVAVVEAAEAVETIFHEGVAVTMNRFN
ncbi:MAG: aminoacyl-tRNA hydrolase [Actinomycetota bacterium]|nr:aminoacyl-tRNA hydrolase [Actinomycetota bacterium]